MTIKYDDLIKNKEALIHQIKDLKKDAEHHIHLDECFEKDVRALTIILDILNNLEEGE